MKRIRRCLAAALAAAALLAVPAQAASLGTPVLGSESELARGVVLADGVYWGSSDFRSENYLLYTPSSDIFPIVVYGSKLCNYGSFSSMTKLLEEQGYHVIGGINGDYYDFSTYCPLGIVIRDGKLISSDGGHYAVGFMADGKAIAGTPALTMTLNIHGQKFPLATVNKLRDKREFALFTEEFAKNTKNSQAGRDAVVSIQSGGNLTANCSLTLKVEEILDASGATALEAGKMILSLSDSADDWRQRGMDSLKAGDTLTLTISSADSRWGQVREASGSLYKLVTDGKVVSGLPSGAEPRTAVGIRADGSSVLYTVDGRQSGYSAGASMTQVAERLAELGCVEACLMDGGGSTSLNALYIGDSQPSLVNSPSGGTPRSVTSYIMLVTRRQAGSATRLGLSPLSLYMLTGAQTTLEAGAADDYGWAAKLPEVHWAVEDLIGAVDQSGHFTAGQSAGVGAVQISASGLKNGTAQVEVVETPHTLTVKNESGGKSVTSLKLGWGDSVNLTAVSAYYNQTLISQDACYTWSVTGDIGTIDGSGSFRAAQKDAAGSIVVQAGDKRVEIPVTVGWKNPFDDISEQNDWYYNEIKYVCQNGLFSGETNSHFGEESGMTRGMFVTVLWRIAGSPAAGDGNFTDVPTQEYYAQAVNWAAKQEIVSGYPDGSFQPNKTISREEICALLYNYAKWAKLELPAGGDLQFQDGDKISPWAKPAVDACTGAQLVNGESNPDGSLTMSPQKTMSRAHAAVLLSRFHSRYY